MTNYGFICVFGGLVKPNSTLLGQCHDWDWKCQK